MGKFRANERLVWYSELGLWLMRWLLIVLFVSLFGLLVAAAATALHILVQRARMRSRFTWGSGKGPNAEPGPVEDSDAESEL